MQRERERKKKEKRQRGEREREELTEENCDLMFPSQFLRNRY